MQGFKPSAGFAGLLDQDRPTSLLSTMLANGKIPHALLFSGTHGTGKESAAITFAMACNCAESTTNTPPEEGTQAQQNIPNPKLPCCRCRSCRKILADTHPDIHKIRPMGKNIRIEQIRELCQTLTLKANEAKTRYVLLFEAQLMNRESSNALLKILEEPPPGTNFILTSSRSEELLPTILSRTQLIRFNPISSKTLEKYLINTYNTPLEKALIFASMAGGSLTKALDFMKDDSGSRKLLALHGWLVSEASEIRKAPVGRRLRFAEKLAKNKENLIDSLDVLASYYRDLLIYKYSPELISNRHLKHKISESSPDFSEDKLLTALGDIQAAQKKINANAGPRLTLEVLISRLARM